jgi:hypothetical protein
VGAVATSIVQGDREVEAPAGGGRRGCAQKLHLGAAAVLLNGLKFLDFVFLFTIVVVYI